MNYGHFPTEAPPLQFCPAYHGEVPPVMSINPAYQELQCGHCAKPVQMRVIAIYKRVDGSTQNWCLCPCERKEASVTTMNAGAVVNQSPIAREFLASHLWHEDLGRLFDEASRSYSAGAFTASATVSRKILMVCACLHGAKEGESFAHYVDFITSSVLRYERAKQSIDAIRGIGNDANHKVEFVTQQQAKRALEIVYYLLNTLYSLPEVGK